MAFLRNRPLVFWALNMWHALYVQPRGTELCQRPFPLDDDCRLHDVLHPLYLAAMLGLYDATLHLAKPAHLAVTPMTWAPLQAAARQGHFDVVDLLLLHDLPPTVEHQQCLQTPLHLAASGGHAEVVDLLANDNMLDVDARDSSGRTPLYLAMEHGHKDAVCALEKHGAVDMTEDTGVTGFHTASANGHAEIVKHVLEQGTSAVDAATRASRTALQFAAARGHLTVVTLLIAHGADIDHVDSVRQTPLHYAIDNQQSHVAELLILRGANLNPQDCPGVLDLAVEKGLDNIVQMLWERGANVEGREV